MYFTDSASGPSRFPNSGYFTIGPGGEFNSFTAAINHVNSQEVIGIGGFIFEVPAGTVFNENPPAITKVASQASPVVFQKVGEGPNPIIRATGTTADSEAIIRLSAVHYYTFDGIDLANYGSTTAMEYGFYLTTSQGRACGYNTIKNCQITLSGSNVNSKGIFSECGTGSRNYYNTYQNVSIVNAHWGIHLLGNSTQYHLGELVTSCQITGARRYGIMAPFGEGTVIENNQISSLAGTTYQFEGISFGAMSASAFVNANTVIGASATNSAFGIYQSLGTSTVSGNTIRGFNTTGNPVTGIRINGGSSTLSGNTVRNLSSNRSVTGIYVGSSASGVSLSRNLVHTLSNTGSNTSYYCAGIDAGGANTLIANNMVHSLSSASGLPASVRGIALQAGSGIRIVFNTVSLSAAAGHTDYSSAALYIPAVATSVELFNNILADQSTPGSGTAGRVCAIWKEASGLTELSASNRNVFWSGTPGPKRLLAYIAGAGYQTLPQYLLISGGRDTASFQEAPPFVSTTDPHIITGVQTNIESGAQPVDGILTDFDGEPRNATLPDIGADEGAFGTMGWTCGPEQLNFGYVCVEGLPALRQILISNTGTSPVSFNSSGFQISGADANNFHMSGLPSSFTIQPAQTQSLTVAFEPNGPSPRVAELAIFDTASNFAGVSLYGIGTQASAMPYLANWEADNDGWTALNGSYQNAWTRGSATAYRDAASFYISSDGGTGNSYNPSSAAIVHVFKDLLLPSSQPRLIFNWKAQGDAADRLSLWLLPSNQTPQPGSLPSGLQLGGWMYGQSGWQSTEVALPQEYAGQRARLVFSWQNDASGGTQSPAAIDNLRLLSIPSAPAVPQSLAAQKVPQGIQLTWQASSGANEYRLESSSNPSEGFTPLFTLGATSFLISNPPPKAFYRVRAME